METSNNGSILSQQTSTCLKMRELIEAVKDYIHSKTDTSAQLINNFLQAYSVTIDVTAFDPYMNLGSQFYVSLYELLSNVDPHSQMAWSCVDVLCNACRNSSAREALINTFRFVPLISQMLTEDLNSVKKKKLLVLLQDLTCGIKLDGQISLLSHLLKTLAKWVEDTNKDVMCLSLSVLVNLCFKNSLAVYTLSRVIDIKQFLRFCLPLKGPQVEVHVCKLMIILSHDDFPRKTVLNLVEPTFSSIKESLSKNDPVMLRSAVEFFVDMLQNENVDIFKSYGLYLEQLDGLIQLLNARNLPSDPDATPLPQYDPQCVHLILKFIQVIEFNKLADFSKLYMKIMNVALNWVNSEEVAHQAYVLITTIIENLSETDDNKRTLNLLVSKLPTFLNILQSESPPTNMDRCKKLCSVLQLLRTLLKSNSTSNYVLQSLNKELVMNIFSPLLSDELLGQLPYLKVTEDSTSTTVVVDLYVYAVGLVYEVAQHDARWLEMFTMLMENRNVHSLLAYALSGGIGQVRQLVLEMCKCPRFPVAKVAAIMDAKQNIFSNGKNPVSNQANLMMSTCNSVYPILGHFQVEKLDDVLSSFKRRVTQDQSLSNISVKEVMDLYEYKLAALSYSELYANSSLKGVSDRCVHLQHRIAQLSTEYSKFQQLIRDYENKVDKNEKSVKDLRNICKEDKKKSDGEIAQREKLISQVQENMRELQTNLTRVQDENCELEAQIVKYKNLITKLEDNGSRVEKQLLTREQQLKNANSHIDGLNTQIKNLEKMLEQKEAKLAETTRNYLGTKELLDTITKMAAGHSGPS